MKENSKILRHEIIKNAIWMFSSEVVDKLLAPILIFLFAREFGSTVLGQYSFVLSFVALGFMFSDLGTTVYAIKKCARDPSKLGFYLSHAAGIRIILVVLSALFVAVSTFFIDKPPVVMYALIVYLISTALSSLQNVFEITFYSQNNLKMIAIGRMVERVSMFAIGLYAILVQKSFIIFMLAHLLAQCAHFSVIYLNSRKYAKPKLLFDWSVWKKFVTFGFPIALTSFLFFVYFKIDILIISFMVGDQAVGWYSAAYRVLDVFQFFPYILSYSVFPALIRLYKTNQQLANALFSRTSRILLIFALPITFGVLALAPWIVQILYGNDFSQSILALRVIILIVPFLFLDSLFRFVIYSINKEWSYLWVLLMLAAFNVVANILLIPKFGFIAAAWATLASEVIGFLMFSRMVRNGGFKSDLRRTYKSLFRAGVIGILAYFGANYMLPYQWATLIGLAAYFLHMFFAEFDDEDKSLLRESVAGIGAYMRNIYNLVKSSM